MALLLLNRLWILALLVLERGITGVHAGQRAKSSISKPSSSATLTFSADLKLLSKNIQSTNLQDIEDFVKHPDIRNLFLSAGGKRSSFLLMDGAESHSQPSKDDQNHLMSLWKDACIRYYGMEEYPFTSSRTSKDGKNEAIIMATETSANFPGFRTINTVVNGCQRGCTIDRKQSKESSKIIHRFYLIADKKRWEGPRPVVWLVKKLTGDALTDDQSEAILLKEKKTPKSFISSLKPSETRAVTQVSIVSLYSPTLQNDGIPSMEKKSKYYGVQLEVINCAVRIEFPKTLLKLLPTSKSKVEKQGTKAIQNVLAKDATAAMKAVEEAWKDRLKKREESKTKLFKSSRMLISSRIPYERVINSHL